MKKILLVFLSVFAFVSAHAAITWEFSDDGTLTISGTDMPNYHYNRPPSWYSKREQIKKVVIKSGVTNIGNYAFDGCYSLTSITIPNSVTSIGEYAFGGCGLISITIPNSVTNILRCAFHECKNLTSITIPNSVTSIGEYAFYGCSDLTSITIPNSVTTIENRAFYLCKNLTSITIPNSVTTIENAVFGSCYSLTSVTIPNSVTTIENAAFDGCYSLTSITIPNSVTSIGEYAFQSCYSLTSIAIPNSVESIGEYAFSYCSSLTSIAIPNSMTNIENNTFDYCSGLKSVTIPNSVTSIGNHAFEGCSSLTSIIIPNSVTNIGDNAFVNCSSLTSVTISNSITDIKDYTFWGCTGLTLIIIPNSVTNIGYMAFYKCYSLTSVTNLSTIPQIISNETFSANGILHVLTGYKEIYQKDAYWKNFTIVEDAIDPYPIELADGKNYNEEATQENKEINYTRTFNNTSWQSLYIPFSMTYNDWKDDFEVAYINSIRQYDNDEDGIIDETIMDVVKVKNGSLIPNTPYLIKAKSTGEKTISMNNATLYQAEENSIECSTMLAKYTFTGTYSTIPAATLLANNYYAMGGGSLIMTDGTSDLKPYRWYLNVESRSPMYNVSSGAKAITINVVGEEEATGISLTSSDREHSSAIYDLNGRRMSQKTLKSGLYIKNGKKIIIK